MCCKCCSLWLTYVLFLHLYDGLVVVIKPKLAKLKEEEEEASGERHQRGNKRVFHDRRRRSSIIISFPRGNWCTTCLQFTDITTTGTHTCTHNGLCSDSSFTVDSYETVGSQWERVLWREHVREESARWPHLDCQGVITPSSGPPINTSFLILRKFVFHSEIEVWKCPAATPSRSVTRFLTAQHNIEVQLLRGFALSCSPVAFGLALSLFRRAK